MKPGSRVLLGSVDQGLSSLSNIILLIVIARTVSLDNFGIFSFGWAVITTVLSVLRGYLGNSVSIAVDSTNRRRETRYGLTVAATAGIATILISAGTVSLLGGFGAGYVMSVFAPVVFMQDLLRFHTVAEGRPHLAVCSDAIWAVTMTVLVSVVALHPRAIGPDTAVVVWGVAGTAGLVLLLVASRVRPALRDIAYWLRSDLANRLHFGVVGAVGAVGSLVIVSIATLIIGVRATAALRGASSVMGPLNVVMAAIPMVIVPEIRRSGAKTPREIWKRIHLMGYVLATFAILAGIGVSLLPTSAGRQLLGASWPSIRPLLPVTGLEYAGIVLMTFAGAVLRASDDGKNLMRIQLVKTGAGIVLGFIAALLVGTPISVSIALCASAAIGFAHLLMLIRADKPLMEAASGSSQGSMKGFKDASEIQLESTHITDQL